MTTRIILAMTAMALLLGCSKLTMENYTKLKAGMTYAEVVKLLGKPDSCSEALFVRNCTWGSEKKNISVNFMNDKVMLALFTGLAELAQRFPSPISVGMGVSVTETV